MLRQTLLAETSEHYGKYLYIQVLGLKRAAYWGITNKCLQLTILLSKISEYIRTSNHI